MASIDVIVEVSELPEKQCVSCSHSSIPLCESNGYRMKEVDIQDEVH
jgi:hypothetical protein